MSERQHSNKQQTPSHEQDFEDDTFSDSSDSSNIPNTPPSKRPRTTSVPQSHVSSSVNNANLSSQRLMAENQGKKTPIIIVEESHKPSNEQQCTAVRRQRESEEDTSPHSSSSKFLPPESKGMEKNIVVVEEDVKKQLFQRVFSEDDEIILLEGLLKFQKNSGGDENGMINMVEFHQFIKGPFQCRFTKPQLSDKIKRLKKRFQKSKGRAFKSDTHEEKIFKLSNKLWGVKESTMKKSSSPLNCLRLCKSGFNGDGYAGFRDSTPDIFEVMVNCDPIMKKKLIDLHIREFELKIAHNLVENEKFQLIMNHLKSQ